MSLDDSTPENMPLDIKTLHDPVSDSNFITGKLTAIPQAGSNRDALHRYHIAFDSFKSTKLGIFKILDQLIFKSLSECLFQATCKIQKRLVQYSWCPSQVLRLPNSLKSYRSSSFAKAPPESTYYYTASPICSKSCL
jgi:hypothetical protein